MYIAILALVNTLIWTYMNIMWKKLRLKGAHSRTTLGLLSGGVPIYFLLAFGLILFTDYTLQSSLKYWLYTTSWIILAFFTNIASISILKDYPLAELRAYRLGFSAIVAALIDLFILKIALTSYIITGAILFIAAGALLSKTKIQKIDYKILAIVLAISLATAIQFTFYKLAIETQTTPVVHGLIAAGIFFTTAFIIGFKQLIEDYKKKIYKLFDFLRFGVLIVIFSIIEVLLFVELPLTIMILLSVLNLVIFAIYDVKTKEIEFSWKIPTAFFITLAALVLINL